MANEQTFIILKPDTVQRGLIGEVVARLEQRGLKFVAMKMIWMDESLAKRHYAALSRKDFFPGLIEFITSGPVVVAVVEGPNAAKTVRDTVGATNPLDAAPGTVRFEFGVSTGRNIIHASQPSEAEQEIANFFAPDELLSYTRDTDRWIVE